MNDFILVGLSSSPDQDIFLFCVFLLIYVIAMASNSLLICAICTCKKLHNPMYFLLINLSLVNMFSISTIAPKLIEILWTHKKTISFSGCIVQVYLFLGGMGTEMILLSFMAFDRYAAICRPLRYTIIMRKEVCIGITCGVWIVGLANAVIHTRLVAKLSFCNSKVINHFFCDLPPLLRLSCSSTKLNETMAFVADVIFGIGSLGLTIASYSFILKAIIRIRSTEGKRKAFSTCSSHLIVVSFYFFSIIYTYMRPASAYSVDKDKFISLLYTVVTPVVNPVIYSLRNKDMKDALKGIVGRARLPDGPHH